MRKKFKIMYPKDHHDKDKAGKVYNPGSRKMVVMNNRGVFFMYYDDPYNPPVVRLSDILPKYDVVWSE